MIEESARVIDVDGTRAIVIKQYPDRQLVLLRLDDERQVMVPVDQLHRHDDGSYRLHIRLAEAARVAEAEERVVIPVIEEELSVRKQKLETGRVQIRRIVEEREEEVDVPLTQERIAIERVPVERIVETMPEIRQEGATTIIPVVEEVLVVEKRLMLVEEVHITKERAEHHEQHRVTLRRTDVEIEHLDADDATVDQ